MLKDFTDFVFNLLKLWTNQLQNNIHLNVIENKIGLFTSVIKKVKISAVNVI